MFRMVFWALAVMFLCVGCRWRVYGHSVFNECVYEADGIEPVVLTRPVRVYRATKKYYRPRHYAGCFVLDDSPEDFSQNFIADKTVMIAPEEEKYSLLPAGTEIEVKEFVKKDFFSRTDFVGHEWCCYLVRVNVPSHPELNSRKLEFFCGDDPGLGSLPWRTGDAPPWEKWYHPMELEDLLPYDFLMRWHCNRIPHV